MNWKNWKGWLLGALAILGIFAIYAFASTGSMLKKQPDETPDAETPPARPARATAASAAARPQLAGGVEPIRFDWLEPETGTYNPRRNLFAFVEPPPPPPPPQPKVVPPPDEDKDGVPDFQDNCPDIANPDQRDIDRNGIGALCQPTEEIPPPPPAPTPPAFDYKLLGTFGTANRPIAAFSKGDEIVNVAVGETFGGKFILRSIGIESVEIGFVGFPPDQHKRVPIGK